MMAAYADFAASLIQPAPPTRGGSPSARRRENADSDSSPTRLYFDDAPREQWDELTVPVRRAEDSVKVNGYEQDLAQGPHGRLTVSELREQRLADVGEHAGQKRQDQRHLQQGQEPREFLHGQQVDKHEVRPVPRLAVAFFRVRCIFGGRGHRSVNFVLATIIMLLFRQL
jgi:hypothetical protein